MCIKVRNSTRTPPYYHTMIFLQAMNDSTELPSQQLDDVLYVAVHLEPLALQAVWLEKIECHHKFFYHRNGEVYNIAVQIPIDLSHRSLGCMFSVVELSIRLSIFPVLARDILLTFLHNALLSDHFKLYHTCIPSLVCT